MEGYYVSDGCIIKKGRHGSGDLVWVVEDGKYRKGRLTCDPYKCDDGIARVLIEDDEGVWEVSLDSLKRKRPKSGELSQTSVLFNEERRQMTKKKVAAKKSVAKKGVNLCKCGCGEAAVRTFLQGHDSRFHGRIRKLADGRMTMDELKKLVKPYAIKGYEEELALHKKTAPKKAVAAKKAVKKGTKSVKKGTKKKATKKAS